MFFSSKKINNSYKLLFDFRSSSLGYAVLSQSKNDTKIVLAKRNYFYFNQITDPETYVNTYYRSLSDYLHQIIFKLPFLKHNLSSIELVMGSPWYECEIKTFNIKKDKKNNKVTQKFIDEVINSNTKVPTDEELIESRITDMKINGYSHDKPLNTKFNNLEFSVYQSKIANQTKHEINSVLGPYFHGKKINFCTHPVMLMSVIKNTHPDLENYIGIEVSGEVTEIFIVLDKKISSVFVVPIGLHQLIKDLCSRCNFQTSVAWSKLDMIASGHYDQTKEKVEQEALNAFKDRWFKEIRNTLDKNDIKLTPPRIVMISDQASQLLFNEILSTPDSYAGAFKNTRKPEIIMCKNEFLHKQTKYLNTKERDIILSIFAEYLKIHSEN